MFLEVHDYIHLSRHAGSHQLVSSLQLGVNSIPSLLALVPNERLSMSCHTQHISFRTKERSYETSCTDAHSARYPVTGCETPSQVHPVATTPSPAEVKLWPFSKSEASCSPRSGIS